MVGAMAFVANGSIAESQIQRGSPLPQRAATCPFVLQKIGKRALKPALTPGSPASPAHAALILLSR